MGAVPLTCIGNLGHHSWPQRHHDGKGNENPDAVGHDEDEELLEGGVPHAVRSSPAAVREGVKIEKCFPEGHDRNREGQRDGVPTGPVVKNDGDDVENNLQAIKQTYSEDKGVVHIGVSLVHSDVVLVWLPDERQTASWQGMGSTHDEGGIPDTEGY